MAQWSFVRYDLQSGRKTVESQMVAVEKLVRVHINGIHLFTFFTSPGMEKELAIGHMLTEAVIKSVRDVEGIRVLNDGRDINVRLKRAFRFPKAKPKFYTSAVVDFTDFAEMLNKVKPLPLSPDMKVGVKDLRRMIEVAEERGIVHRESRGCHLAAIFTKDANLISFSEDVGRHNAVDKVIGAAALKGAEFSRLVLLSSGRQSAHMVLKSAIVGIPVIITLAYPLKSGLDVAEKAKITLIHFRRGERFLKIFTFPERISY